MSRTLGGQHQYAMSSGYNSGSRFGFRGTEDLGDGLKTVFDLENGFDNTTGKASQGACCSAGKRTLACRRAPRVP